MAVCSRWCSPGLLWSCGRLPALSSAVTHGFVGTSSRCSGSLTAHTHTHTHSVTHSVTHSRVTWTWQSHMVYERSETRFPHFDHSACDVIQVFSPLYAGVPRAGCWPVWSQCESLEGCRRKRKKRQHINAIKPIISVVPTHTHHSTIKG